MSRMARYSDKYITWLEQQSLLYSAKQLSKQMSGNKLQWQKPYAKPIIEELTIITNNKITINLDPLEGKVLLT